MGNSNYEALRAELIRMAEEDQRVREELLRSDQLPRNRYSEHMAKVHRRNNTRLRELIEKYGWPGKSLVEEDGCKAAWLIAQHAVLDPNLQLDCLSLLEKAVGAGEAPLWQLAYLKDRVLLSENKPQIYGTQLRPWACGSLYTVDN